MTSLSRSQDECLWYDVESEGMTLQSSLSPVELSPLDTSGIAANKDPATVRRISSNLSVAEDTPRG